MKITYIGTDKKYWKRIQEKYIELFPREEFQFKQYKFEDSDPYLYRIFKMIFLQRPSILYLDFSLKAKEMMRLIKNIRRDDSTSSITSVILLDKKKDVKTFSFCRPHFFFIKGVEIYDVVNSPTLITLKKISENSNFRGRSLQEKMEIFEELRIGYYAADHIHVEGDPQFSTGDSVKLEVNAIPKGFPFPKKDLVVAKVDNKNLYYRYKYSYNLYFPHSKTPDYQELETVRNHKFEKLKSSFKSLGPDEVSSKIKKFNKLFPSISHYKKEHKKKMEDFIEKRRAWIKKNKGKIEPKKTKFLIIDNKLALFDHLNKNLDDLPYSIKTISHLDEDSDYIDRLRPHVIAFIFNETVEPPYKKSGVPQIKGIIDKVKEDPDYQPFILILDCKKFSSSDLVALLDYKNIIVRKEGVKLKTILELGKIYEKKNKSLFQDSEDRYYVDPKDIVSHVHVSFPIVLDFISESEIKFYSRNDFLLYHSYRLEIPVQFHITIIPLEIKDKKKNIEGTTYYRGLIHSVTEDDKQKLRKYINKKG